MADSENGEIPASASASESWRAALDVLESLATAAYSSDKRALLDQANRGVNSLRFLLRLSFDLKPLGSDSQEFAAGKLEEIGRMIGGSRKAAQRAQR